MGIAPFTGLTVIDFTHVLAGPACAYYFGLLGAQIIKVESPRGDGMRHRGGTDQALAQAGMSTAFQTQGAGKASVIIDLETDEGRSAMKALLATADVFIENHLPKTLRRLQLHEDTTLKDYPTLIHCAMTGYGRGGPQENAPAYDVNIQASSGLMDMTGTAQSGPIRTGAPIVDYATALAASFAISAALFEREKTGRGSFVDVSMQETAFTMMSSTITDYLATGHTPQRRGNLANSRSPGAGSFPCKEGIISLGVNEEQHFVALAQALDREDWLSDDRFANPVQRKANAGALVLELEAALLFKTAHEWEPVLQNAGVPSARLRSMPDALASAQTQARSFIHQDEGLSTPTLPFRLSGAAAHTPRGHVPGLGEHTHTVLSDLTNVTGAKP